MIFLADVSDIFNFFRLGEGEGGVRGRREGGGQFFIENPRRGGGSLQEEGPRAREVSAANWGFLGGSKSFFWGSKCTPSFGIVTLRWPILGARNARSLSRKCLPWWNVVKRSRNHKDLFFSKRFAWNGFAQKIMAARLQNEIASKRINHEDCGAPIGAFFCPAIRAFT